jgi:hypothetical protein
MNQALWLTFWNPSWYENSDMTLKDVVNKSITDAAAALEESLQNFKCI